MSSRKSSEATSSGDGDPSPSQSVLLTVTMDTSAESWENTRESKKIKIMCDALTRSRIWAKFFQLFFTHIFAITSL